MNTSIEPKTGSWILLVGPRPIRYMMAKVIAGLAEREQVNVLDGANQFQAYQVARLVRGRPEILERIKVARAFSCYQMLALLENTPSMQVPFVVLNLLRTFYDEDIKFGERKRLLKGCLDNLSRLEKYAGGVVSVSPPRLPSQEAVELFKMVEAEAKDTYRMEIMVPSTELLRLF